MRASDVFILLGPPGSGKGSLSQLCVKNFGWQQISAGNLCRQHIIEGTAIGVQIAQAIEAGYLAPEELVSKMIIDSLDKQVDGKSIILDGFPRTVLQAQLLDNFLNEQRGRFYLHVVKLKVCDDHVIDRMLHRYVCKRSTCQMVYSSQVDALSSKNGITCDVCGDTLIKRQDDNEESIKERLRIYHRYENDLTHYYEKTERHIIEINVEVALPIVFNTFVQLFNQSHATALMVDGI